MELSQALQALLIEHHVATTRSPLPPLRAVAGDYVLAANGVFKRVARPGLALTIQIEQFRTSVPGLRTISAGVTWEQWPQKLPGTLLLEFLERAQQAISGEPTSLVLSLRRPIEFHAVFAYQDGTVRLIDTTKAATATTVEYWLPETTLLRIHSHHTMPAFFSQDDDQDDEDCSVSAVIGHICSEHPQIQVRANAYGHRQIIQANEISDYLGPFQEQPNERRLQYSPFSD